jgi:hypothetical protein
MQTFHRLGIANNQVIDATIVLLTTELFGGKFHSLDIGPHRTVKNQDMFFQLIQVTTVCIFTLLYQL